MCFNLIKRFRFKMKVSPKLRQLTVVLSAQLAAVSVGGAVTYPTLLLEWLRKNNEDAMQLDVTTQSWIGSIYGLAGIPAVLMPVISQKIGRKWGFITACLSITFGWIIAYRSTSITELLISEAFHGLGTNSLLPVCYMSMTEMLAPKFRHISMQTYGIAQAVGMTSCGILGRYLHYKIISLIMFIPIIASIGLALIWLESPSWLACRGEFDKCEQVFVRLRGIDDHSQQELQQLITAQRENLKNTKQQMTIKGFWKKITGKDFYVPSLHTFIVLLTMYWGGIDAIYVYFFEIIKKSSTNDNSIYFGSIVMYSLVLGGLILTNFVIRKFNNKSVLFYSAGASAVCLVLSCIISGLQTTGVLSPSSPLLMYTLLVYTGCANIGYHNICFIIAVELMPVRHRSLGGALLIIFNCVLYASSLKLSPYITQNLGLWCTFLVYALNIAGCLWFISKYVPETKGKSLQDIEDFYMFGKFVKRHITDYSQLTELKFLK